MKYIWPQNQHRSERAQDLQDERIEKGMFRCDRCDLLKPMPPEIQDGVRLCRRCQDPLFPAMAQRIMGEDAAKAAQQPISFLPYPVKSCFDADPVVTAVSPLTLNLARGGASGTVTITGVNLTTADTWDGSDANITVTPTVNSSTSVSLDVSAVGATTRGNYSITFNGDVLTPRGMLKVR